MARPCNNLIIGRNLLVRGLTMNPAQFVIRLEDRYDPAIAEELSRLADRTFRESMGHLYKAEDIALFMEEKHAPEVYGALLKDPSFGIWTARDEKGDAVAYLVVGPCDLPVPDRPDSAGEIIRFYADKSIRGKGVGGRLIEKGLAWLEHRFGHIYLSVYSENFAAQRLYARYGFEKVHEYLYRVGNQSDPEFILKRK